MALLRILKYPDPVLATRALPVDAVDDSIKTLITDMTETMYNAAGIGLAATQVGVGKRVIVLDVPDEEVEGSDAAAYKRGKNLVALVNPEIINTTGSTKYEEGCLSVPGETATVERFAEVRVRALNHKGQGVVFDASGLFAIALQHEIDHLDGILFIDRLSRLKREFIKRRLRKAAEAEVRAL